MTVATQTVADDEAGIRLDRWFRRHHPGLTQGALQKLCRTGQIRIDGKRAEAATRLSAGQSVRVPPLPAQQTDSEGHRVDQRDVEALAAITLYEDDHLIVFDKPAGLPSQGGPGIVRHVDGMAASLRDGRGRRPLLVHRLDRDTSGVLVMAKGPANAARLAASFRSRGMRKTYWAVVVGKPVPAEGVIDAPLARLGGGAGALTVLAERDDDDAASARTEYRTLDAAARRMAWLELTPLTGRTHQLRVHCEALGVPILGDPKYGEDRSHMDGFTDKLHLHARALALPHPDGGTLTVTAPLPPHMRETFDRLGFTAPRDAAITRS
jgi:23S rRNA pseudouridine955/2504/2580 synthase